MLRKWKIGVSDLNCVISYQLLDNPQLTEQQAVSIVDRWNIVDVGRRLNWLVGREEGARNGDR